MRRWNGWGRKDVDYPLSDSASAYLADQIGRGTPRPSATFEDVLRYVPQSRLPNHHSYSLEPADRLRHSRGQSLPDWIATSSGNIDTIPDGVAFPGNEDNLRDVLIHAKKNGVTIIPYGGGTSVVGHINPLPGQAPVLTVDMGRMNQLTGFDEVSRLATFAAGVTGPDLEQVLNRRGFTMGHFPQSFEYSTLGGWIATRSSGQQSRYYGRIEDLFAGGKIETYQGSWELPPFPASAAGPDLRQLILGSEGRFGIISQATMRVRFMPENEQFRAIIFPELDSAIDAVRTMSQNQVPVSMLRLSDSQETAANLALSGKESLITWADRGLRLLRFGSDRCLLIYGLTGSRSTNRKAGSEMIGIARKFGGLGLGDIIGKQWQKGRFLTPYLRNTLWQRGYAVDTLETAISWSAIPDTMLAIRRAIQRGLESFDERVLVLTHLSHVYQDGASIYVTYIFRRASGPVETLARWQAMKNAASEVIVDKGGTISHQHGVGRDHAPYLIFEKRSQGMEMLASLSRTIDPAGIFNPGKLILDEPPE